MLRRTLAALVAAIALIAGTLVAAAPASADGGLWCNANGDCYMTLSSRPTDPRPNPDSNGWTPGAPSCWVEITADLADSLGYEPEDLRAWTGGNGVTFYATIACSSQAGYWSNNRQCYVHMVDGVWPQRPPSYKQDAGYYMCIQPMMFGAGVVSYFWSNTVPPGLKVYTPGMAAMKLIETFQLRGIDIGMAPEVNPAWGHRRSYVGIPVWFWVNNPQPLTWGPYSETATLGGQTITATAKVTSVRWSTGDGGSKVCGGLGTAYTSGYGVTDSPTCGYRYQSTSQSQAGDRYTVTATSQWVVTWTALSGASGTVNLTSSSTANLEVNELQTVNTGTSGSDGNNGG
ncbi:ATP/GTP-binding protein [Microbacterium sp. CH12i]|uniref:hypothetical protein n=1 Tax=Microbacterium sp. CH12i TaxID=1479651 RepID=UPI0004618BBA|nr:hypothetical protein [Microbacterium sp. CH12i]KDA06947.1 ATP/GTP-binding protein [Microbacterium sp. CH12i]